MVVISVHVHGVEIIIIINPMEKCFLGRFQGGGTNGSESTFVTEQLMKYIEQVGKYKINNTSNNVELMNRHRKIALRLLQEIFEI